MNGSFVAGTSDVSMLSEPLPEPDPLTSNKTVVSDEETTGATAIAEDGTAVGRDCEGMGIWKVLLGPDINVTEEATTKPEDGVEKGSGKPTAKVKVDMNTEISLVSKPESTPLPASLEVVATGLV